MGTTLDLPEDLVRQMKLRAVREGRNLKKNGVMKLPDVNIWLALALSGHSHHAVARKWLGGESTPGPICFCRATQQGLMRLLTAKAVLAPYGIAALTNRAAWQMGGQFPADDRITFAAALGESAGPVPGLISAP